MATEIEIANMALNFLGVDMISSLADNTKTAKLINNVFQTAKKSTLQDHNWKFAIKRAELAYISETPLFEYKFVFQLPMDLLKIVETYPANVEYAIEGGTLLSNYENFAIKYVHDVQNEQLYTPMFAEALALKLASLLAYPLTNSTTLEQSKLQIYIDFLKRCKSNDSTQGTPKKLFRDTFLDSRL
jgi:hypothetical protein